MKYPYQLPCSPEACYILFDNADEEDRLVIKATVQQLKGDEYKFIKKKIHKCHGEETAPENCFLSFFKYVIIHHNNDIKYINLDILRYIKPLGNVNKSLLSHNVIELDRLIFNITKHNIELPLKELFTENKPKIQCDLIYKTNKHGTVTLKLSKFKDPNIRNGIHINLSKNVNIKSCWGAMVKAANPKLLKIKKWDKLPKIKSSCEMEKFNNNDYYVKLDTKIRYDNTEKEFHILTPNKLGNNQVKKMVAGWK